MTQGETKPSKSKLLRMSDLTADYGLKPASVYRWIGEGRFPVPVSIGPNSVAWHLEEIEAWRQSRPRAKIRIKSAINDNHPLQAGKEGRA